MRTINFERFYREILLTPILAGFVLFAFAQNINVIPTPEDTLGIHVCGNLHEFTVHSQFDYKEFKNGGNNMKSAASWDPAAVIQCGSFTVYYEDLDNPIFQGQGFDHPIHGTARRNTFCEVLNYVESVLNIHPNANPEILVCGSYSTVKSDASLEKSKI